MKIFKCRRVGTPVWMHCWIAPWLATRLSRRASALKSACMRDWPLKRISRAARCSYCRGSGLHLESWLPRWCLRRSIIICRDLSSQSRNPIQRASPCWQKEIRKGHPLRSVIRPRRRRGRGQYTDTSVLVPSFRQTFGKHVPRVTPRQRNPLRSRRDCFCALCIKVTRRRWRC